MTVSAISPWTIGLFTMVQAHWPVLGTRWAWSSSGQLLQNHSSKTLLLKLQLAYESPEEVVKMQMLILLILVGAQDSVSLISSQRCWCRVSSDLSLSNKVLVDPQMVPCPVSRSIRAAITQCNWVAYEHQKLISHSSGTWKSKIRLPAWSGGSPFPGHRLTVSSLGRRS